MGFWEPSGRFWSHLGAFWSHFGDFFRVRWIFENVCFIIVKHYFLRFGRVRIRDFFMSCFRSKIVGAFLVKFFGFVGFQGPHRIPNWSLLGTLRGTLAQKGEF